MRRYHAAWMLPVTAPPIRQGWALVADGRVLATGVGRAGDPWDSVNALASVDPGFSRAAWDAAEIVDLGSAALLPGLVNAHTHLELSWMRGRMAPARTMPDWVASLLDLRAAEGEDVVPAIVEAIAELEAAGTAVVGDVSNTLASYAPLVASGLDAVIFHELLGFRGRDAAAHLAAARTRIETLLSRGRVNVTLAPHAPYSVSPALFGALAGHRGPGARLPTTVHLAESAEEIEFLATGSGAWREILTRVGAWDEEWAPPGCGPLEYLDRLGWIDSSCLVVHGVHLTEPELDRLAEVGATVVTCPRSNRLTGAGTPPIAGFYAAGVAVAIGTDSLASAPDLSVFAELHEVRRLAPDVPARALIESATSIGARALGVHTHGAIAAGAGADLVTVSVPAGVEDVEEYLVSGIPSTDIRKVAAVEARAAC